MEMDKSERITDLVEKYSDDLYRFAFSKTKDHEISQDLVQETLIVAFQKIDNFRGDSSVKTWLTSILKFKVADYYRAKIKEKVSDVEIGDISESFKSNGGWNPEKSPFAFGDDEELLDNPAFVKIFNGCIEGLPELWSAIIKMKYINPKDSSAIRKEFGITDTNMWQIVHRSKLKLKDCLKLNWVNQN
jgi:RNA polymerase sigma-70 factor (ECF subfamily)